MRILAVTYCRAMFGANKALLELIKDLRDRYNVETEVLMPSVNDGDLAEVLDKEGITHYEMPMKMWVFPLQTKYKILRSISAQIKTTFLSRDIHKALKNNKYDLVYSNNSTVQYGAILAKKMSIPHIWHIRELGRYHYDYDFSYPYKKRVKYFREANAVIAISEVVKKYAQEELCPGANIIKVYDGIKISDFPHKTKNADIVKIVYVAALQKGKNHIELFKALKTLKERINTNFKVYIIGDGPEEKELKDYCSKNDIADKIKFCGYRLDVANLISGMDIGVICSKAEGFGLVTCEYMLAGLPVIGADSGATVELVKDGYNGYVYPFGKYDELAIKLEELISDAGKRAYMGKNGYERVKNEFSLNRNTDEIYKIFKDAVGK